MSSNSKRNLRAVCAKNPAVIDIVVGSEAAQTPSLLISFSVFSTNAKGGIQAKHAVSPGIII